MFTTTKINPDDAKTLRFELFKDSVISAVFSLFSSRKKEAKAQGSKFLLQDVAERVGVDKSQASRWFSGDASPNMRLSTLYGLCDALDGDVRIQIVDRRSGTVHTPHGVDTPAWSSTSTMDMHLVLYHELGHASLKHTRFDNCHRSWSHPTSTVFVVAGTQSVMLGEPRGIHASA